MIPGYFEAVVGRYTVPIHNLVLAPGCIREGQGVLVGVFGHALGKGIPAAGWGSLFSEGDEIICRGRFDLSLPIGRMGYDTLQRTRARAHWSISFHVLATYLGIRASRDAAATVRVTRAYLWEVSVNLKAADRGTRTLSIDGVQVPPRVPVPVLGA